MTTAIFFLAALSNSCNQNFEFWDPKMVGSSSHPEQIRALPKCGWYDAPPGGRAGNSGTTRWLQHAAPTPRRGEYPRVTPSIVMNDDELLLKIIELI